QPIVLAGAPGTLFLRGANSTGTAFDYALAGVLSGTGGFSKTGAGMITLGAVNTFAGAVSVDAGTLAVNGSLAAGGSVSVNAGGSLSGAGTINRALLLNQGGAISPLGTLTAASLLWNGNSRLALRLGGSGSSDRLALGGAMSRGNAGTHEIALTPGA